MTTTHSTGAPTASPLVKSWFPYWRPKPQARLRLFCFPFAGGAASLFHRWAALDPSVDVLAIQYPGRETRLSEPPYRSILSLVEMLGPVVRTLLDRPFAFFGYSLGTYVCLELAYWLQHANAPSPLGLMLAAGIPPHHKRSRSLHTLPDTDFIAELRKYGGTPAQVLEHRELMAMLMPILRADFQMVEEYRRTPEPPLALPLTAWGGSEDANVSSDALNAWRDFSSGDFALHTLPGGHFFFLSAREALQESMNLTLSQWAAKMN